MANRIGIMGNFNTGKSYSRKFLKNPKEVVVLMPSRKESYLVDENGKHLPALPSLAEAKVISSKGQPIPGNWAVVDGMKDLSNYMDMINYAMPHIKVIILADFTHYISKRMASKSFMNQNTGGGAFARFWEMAADSLNSFFLKTDTMREDLLVVTEFHTEYDENTHMFSLYVPGGKMLKEKFLPESYFDIMLFTHVEKDEETGDVIDYKFVTRQWRYYNARSMNLFKETLIPNNLQLVIDKAREYFHGSPE